MVWPGRLPAITGTVTFDLSECPTEHVTRTVNVAEAEHVTGTVDVS